MSDITIQDIENVIYRTMLSSKVDSSIIDFGTIKTGAEEIMSLINREPISNTQCCDNPKHKTIVNDLFENWIECENCKLEIVDGKPIIKTK